MGRNGFGVYVESSYCSCLCKTELLDVSFPTSLTEIA